MKSSRRLAAIMFSDIVGYSAMMHADEDRGRHLVRRYRQVLEEKVLSHGGEIIKHYGDGTLCVFTSAIESVRCAHEIQISLQKGDIVPLRIGLHTGDIVLEDEDIYGDGVNIASRVESMAVEGAVLLTERIAIDLRNHLDLPVVSLGKFAFKNIEDPMEVFALATDGLAIPVREEMLGKGKAHETQRRGSKSLSIFRILLGAAVVGIIVWQLWSSKNIDKLKSARIAVHFTDYANLPDQTDLADMTDHWITNRLMDIPDVQLVSYENASSHRDVLFAGAGEDTWRTFARRTGAVNLLQGQIFRQGDSLIFEAHITDLNNAIILQQFKQVVCNKNEPLKGVQELTKKVQGWWASKDAKVITLPKYEAYRAYLGAKSVWEENDSLSEARLLQSISIDSSFMDAYLLLMDFRYNNRQFAERDSLIRVVKRLFPNPTDRQANLIAYHEADIRGDLVSAYHHFLNEFEHDPFDLFNNSDGMLLAVEYVNDLQSAIEMFRKIPSEVSEYEDCRYCDNRLHFVTKAYLDLGMIDSAKQIADQIEPVTHKNLEIKIRSRMSENDTAYINNMIQLAVETPDINQEFVWAYTTRYYNLIGNAPMAQYYAEQSLSYYDSTDARAGTVECNYWSGNYPMAKRLVDTWLPQYAEHRYVIMFGTRAIARAGTEDEITQWYLHLSNLAEERKYSYGLYTYMMGVMSCIGGDLDRAMELVAKAYQEGHQFKEFEPTYNNDPDLKPLFNHAEWEKLMHPLRAQ